MTSPTRKKPFRQTLWALKKSNGYFHFNGNSYPVCSTDRFIIKTIAEVNDISGTPVKMELREVRR